MNEKKAKRIANHVKDVMDLHGVENFILLIDEPKNGFFSMTGTFQNESILVPVSKAVVELAK